MEKNALLAVVLSTLVITGYFAWQRSQFAASQDTTQQPQNTTGAAEANPQPKAGTTGSDVRIAREVGGSGIPVAVGKDPEQQGEIVYRNDLLNVVFDPNGARVLSFELLNHVDGDRPVQMVKRDGSDRAAFEIRWSNDPQEVLLAEFFRRDTADPDRIVFERDFQVDDGPVFTLTRSYRFFPDQYMFEMTIELQNSVGQVLPPGPSAYGYLLSYGPQIGPNFTDLSGRYGEFRRFYYYDGKRRATLRVDSGNSADLTKRSQWFALSGKYFAVIAVPPNSDYTFRASLSPPEGREDGASFAIIRPAFQSAAHRDVYRFYIGPKIPEHLNRYDSADDNPLGIGGLELGRVQETRRLFGWLENILKAILQAIYSLVPNYGLAIIILTILVKLALLPLTRKGSESIAKMQDLNPQLQELRTKYADNPQKMNQEMAKFYKREGVNPLGGCLPLALQFPFFIAMFGVFNNHFDLRGAQFISGWITDLSAPESIVSFGGFSVPLIGWTDLRLLPILFLGSQLVSGKLMQTPTTSVGAQAKIMQYGMPIFFFFLLYNMPSGLLVYWIFSNILTVVQQQLINRRRHAAES